MNIDNLDEFTRAYIECALWSSLDDETPMDENYGFDDLSDECLSRMLNDCSKFQTENMKMISEDLPQAGHDFWLTRNGHGAGFWDGDWPEFGALLTEKCKEFGEVDLYVGEDGLVYC